MDRNFENNLIFYEDIDTACTVERLEWVDHNNNQMTHNCFFEDGPNI